MLLNEYQVEKKRLADFREPKTLCPVCSRYDYEEKLQERVLWNLHSLANMLKEVWDTSVVNYTIFKVENKLSKRMINLLKKIYSSKL